MTNNDLFYTCALIEFIGRETKNTLQAVVEKLKVAGIRKLLKDAPVNHCLSFEQVGEETVEAYGIEAGSFDSVAMAKYALPGFQDIGKLYAIIIEAVAAEGDDIAQVAYDVLASFLSYEISHFSTDLYYQNPDYLVESYKAGYLLPD